MGMLPLPWQPCDVRGLHSAIGSHARSILLSSPSRGHSRIAGKRHSIGAARLRTLRCELKPSRCVPPQRESGRQPPSAGAAHRSRMDRKRGPAAAGRRFRHMRRRIASTDMSRATSDGTCQTSQSIRLTVAAWPIARTGFSARNVQLPRHLKSTAPRGHMSRVS